MVAGSPRSRHNLGMRILWDDPASAVVFDRPLARIEATDSAQVPDALAALEAARKAGHWLAGWLGYELGHALESRLGGGGGGLLLSFGVFDAPARSRPSPRGRAYAGRLAWQWDEATYGAAFARVKAYIAAGDIYQANLTLRAHFAFAGDPLAFYETLRAASAAPYCAYVADGGRHILSLSPELFFALDADGTITARPMKGTMSRAQAPEALAASPKDRAENLMIVDLIRNDLGRIAELGSVAVKDLFAVETYPTLHAMVSTVTARQRQGTTIAEIVRALFPCGSITGAPKIRAMEILRDVEAGPRGAYCGAIGYFAPSKGEKGGSARFNVAIRTITLENGRGELGVGGGVVQDSDRDGEYAECRLKTRFLEAARRPLELIETLKWDGGFLRLESHLARMAASASVFGLAFDERRARGALRDATLGKTGPLRLRLILDEAGRHRASAAPLSPNPPFWSFALSSVRIASGDLLLRHKTNWRELYDSEPARLGVDEAIFLNERGELAEGARSNLFIRRGGEWLTPASSCGLLDGRLRSELLTQGWCREAVLTPEHLGGDILLGNSLRGLIPAVPAKSQAGVTLAASAE